MDPKWEPKSIKDQFKKASEKLCFVGGLKVAFSRQTRRTGPPHTPGCTPGALPGCTTRVYPPGVPPWCSPPTYRVDITPPTGFHARLLLVGGETMDSNTPTDGRVGGLVLP